jgi:hypothetical protein
MKSLLLLLLVLAGCAALDSGGAGGVARTDHHKIVPGLHSKADVRLLMGVPVYEGPFRPTFPAQKLPGACPKSSTSFHYLGRYDSSTGAITGLVVAHYKFRQADVIHFDDQGLVCAVSSRACNNHHGRDRCYDDVEKGIVRPYSF